MAMELVGNAALTTVAHKMGAASERVIESV